MIIKTELDKTVAAFVADLTALIRRVALEHVQRVLEADGRQRRSGAPTQVRRPAPGRPATVKPAATRLPPPARQEDASRLQKKSSVAPQAEARQPSSKPQAASPRASAWSAFKPPAGKLPADPKAHVESPRPRRDVVPFVPVPVKKAKVRRRPKAASPAPAPAPVEATPARNWVVVRRPARDRQAPSSDTAGTRAPEGQPGATSDRGSRSS